MPFEFPNLTERIFCVSLIWIYNSCGSISTPLLLFSIQGGNSTIFPFKYSSYNGSIPPTSSIVNGAGGETTGPTGIWIWGFSSFAPLVVWLGFSAVLFANSFLSSVLFSSFANIFYLLKNDILMVVKLLKTSKRAVRVET